MVAYRPYKSTKPDYIKTVYQQQFLHLSIMVEHSFLIKVYDEDLCAQLKNWKYRVYLVIFSINFNYDVGVVNIVEWIKVEHLGIK